MGKPQADQGDGSCVSIALFTPSPLSPAWTWPPVGATGRSCLEAVGCVLTSGSSWSHLEPCPSAGWSSHSVLQDRREFGESLCSRGGTAHRPVLEGCQPRTRGPCCVPSILRLTNLRLSYLIRQLPLGECKWDLY